MLCKKIKSFLLILIFLSVAFGTSFTADKNAVNEDVLINNLQVAKSKNEKEKSLKELFYYYVNMKRWNDIINISEDLLKYKLTKKEKYNVYYNLAIAYMNNRRFESAIDVAREAEYLYPKKIDIKMLMGRIYRDNRLYELAIMKFKNVLDLDRGHVTALINLGDIYRILKNYKAALEYYTKAIKLRKNLAEEVYVNTAVSYKEFGKLDDAADVLKNIKGKNKSAALLLAEIYKIKQDFLKAEKILLPYVYGKEVDIEVYCKLAELYLISKNCTEAKNLLTFYKSKIKNKNVEVVDFLLAEAYYGLNERKKAMKIMDDIFKYSKSDYIKDIMEKTIKFVKLKKSQGDSSAF